ncbi:murein hydrolase activator EnvC family protein [Streptomyces mirabilis]|uniref:murein hydrolase activator EnvC family protein n=1 Tax=Streptomyces mirabilis TaxID=68239 RepID=UPI00332ABE40
MRAKRCVRTWLGLLLGMTVTVLGATAVGALTPSALARANGPAPPSAAGPSVPDATVPPLARLWPVALRPSVLRGWDPPATPYARGHRGVDLAAPPGAPVRSVAAGRVSFAGRVAGRGAVAVELTGTGAPPLRTTFTPVRATVHEGDEVTAGEVLGTLEPGDAHCGTPCLHWGLRRDRTYLNPLSLLPPWLLHRDPSRLLPVTSALP